MNFNIELEDTWHDKLLQNIQVLTLHFSRYTITFNLEYS